MKEILKERIINGQYPKNSLIPSEPELEKEFEVSKITIRRAVEQLAQEGYVEKKAALGRQYWRTRLFRSFPKDSVFLNI